MGSKRDCRGQIERKTESERVEGERVNVRVTERRGKNSKETERLLRSPLFDNKI